jgi:hypothetical protein
LSASAVAAAVVLAWSMLFSGVSTMAALHSMTTQRARPCKRQRRLAYMTCIAASLAAAFGFVLDSELWVSN